MTYDIKKDNYLIITDSFNIKHLVKVTTIMDIVRDSNISYGGIVIKSLEESNLNTINFAIENVEMCFSEKPNIDTLEEEYPELWI